VRAAFVVVGLVACGAAPPEPASKPATAAVPADAAIDAPHRIDPDLERTPPPKLLSIDWDKVSVGSDGDALALWAQIAPTGTDFEEKLYEVPSGPITKALAVALLRQGNFTCKHVVPSCGAVTYEIEQPAASSTLADPCLRRVLALWALDQLESADLAEIRDALPAIVTIPPPESDLVADVLVKAELDPDENARLDLVARAWNAGQRELAGVRLGGFDETHLVEAVQKYHIDPALEVLSASTDRGVYLAAIADTHLQPATRARAIAELVEDSPDSLEPDFHAVLVAATKASDCGIAGAAAFALVHYKALSPPKPPATMRTLCVAASYEQLQHENEPSPLGQLVPKRGLELVRGAADPNERQTFLIPPEVAVFPEGEDVVRAFQHCKGTTCSSQEHDFHFTIRDGLLARIEVDDRPDPCP
jgi:hypothetical protein